MDELVRGCALLVGLLFISAGAPKVVAPRYAGSALRRVIRRSAVRSDEALLSAARGLGGYEIVLGIALVLVGGPAASALAAAAAMTLVAFTVFVVAAVRRGSHCGCWATLTEGPATGAEVARSGAIALVAAVVLGGRLAGYTRAGIDPATVGWAGTALVLVAVVSWVGGRLAPVRAPRVARQLLVQRPPTTLGRIGAWVAFQSGFVHAGTDAGRRRYAMSRQAPGRVVPVKKRSQQRKETPWPTSRT